MFSRVHYFILILFRYRYSRNYIKTTTLCGNLYSLNILYCTLQHMFYETTLCFFAELKLKILIPVLFYRHSTIKNQKRNTDIICQSEEATRGTESLVSARKSCKCPNTPSNLSGLIYCGTFVAAQLC